MAKIVREITGAVPFDGTPARTIDRSPEDAKTLGVRGKIVKVGGQDVHRQSIKATPRTLKVFGTIDSGSKSGPREDASTSLPWSMLPTLADRAGLDADDAALFLSRFPQDGSDPVAPDDADAVHRVMRRVIDSLVGATLVVTDADTGASKLLA